jgi:hypothetical protein
MAVIDHTVVLTIKPAEPGPADKPNPPKVYRIVGMGPLVRAHFVQILKTRAWAELDRQAQYVIPSRFNRLESSVMRDMTAGKYEWGDEIHNSIEGTKAGATAMLLARLKAANPDANDDDVETLVNKYGWDRLIGYMNQADGPPLPNSPAPATSGAESMTSNSSGPSSGTTPEPTPKASGNSPTA